MQKKILYPSQNEVQSLGQLQINVINPKGYRPIEQANVSIQRTGFDTQPLEVLKTNISGQTPTIELSAPPKEYSLEPGNPQPYSEYSIKVEAPGYETVLISGTQILPDSVALQEVQLLQKAEVSANQQIVISIGPHTLFGDYPPKIPEDPVKEDVEEGYIVLTNPVIPATIIVHDGPPTDPGAKNYYVPFKDYIKNVASSEIYSTWPANTIQANILCILSFTLNRIYTEWYRAKGYNFNITSSTAYDHKFIYGRNIYKGISAEVDALFTNYVSRPGIKQPLLTQYCDGYKVECPTWLTQWGSKNLGDQGYSTINILKNFYGSDIFLKTATQVTGIPSSFPGYNLQLGSRGSTVKIIQNQLNAISNNFPAVPKNRADSIFNESTQNAVRKFQEVFDLPPNGIVDYPTWYKISDIYTAVTRMAEL